MLQVDILSGYAICSAGALVAVMMLRLAETEEPRLAGAMRACEWAFFTLFVALLPAAFGERVVAQPWAQWLITAGSIIGMLGLARGLGLLHGRVVGRLRLALLIGGAAVACWAAVQTGPWALAWTFVSLLTATTTYILWLTRGFLISPRDITETLLGWMLAALVTSMWFRMALLYGYGGPPRIDLMYTPAALQPVFATLYGVVPMLVATLVLNIVNARLRQQLRARANTDELTSVLTRRALREMAAGLLLRERAAEREVAVMMMDVDRFKSINDNFGHHAGDVVLAMTAQLLQSLMRPDALLARWGGEEFIAVVPVENLPAARAVAERLRQAVEISSWGSPSHAMAMPRSVTMSVGVAMVGSTETLDEAIDRADEALYRAKKDGRNQCQVSLMVA